MTSLLERAIALAVAAHAGQTDKAGAAYILHPLRLMLKFSDDAARMVAVLHDAVEDSNMTLADLHVAGFPPMVVAAIDRLTKRPGEDYQAFIARLAVDPLARRVKIEDLKDNMDLTRLSELTEADCHRLAKYRRALSVLDNFPDQDRA